MLALYVIIAGIVTVIFFKFILYFVVGFISYMTTLAVDKKPIGQMIIVVTSLLILQVIVIEIDKRKDDFQRIANLGMSQAVWNSPVNGEITKYFEDGVHHGIDIATPEGTPVYAERRGYVLEAGNMEVYGLTVIIDYGDNISWLYGHNSKILVKKGQMVLKGTMISMTGNTGKSDGPHLHLEIRKKNVPVDPLIYLK